MDTYIDRYMDDPEGNRDWSNIYNDITWEPLPWLGIDVETQLPIVAGGSGFSEFNTRARFMPYENMELSVSYRHLNNHPVLLDSDRIDLGHIHPPQRELGNRFTPYLRNGRWNS